jgi:hypothetical protein
VGFDDERGVFCGWFKIKLTLDQEFFEVGLRLCVILAA